MARLIIVSVTYIGVAAILLWQTPAPAADYTWTDGSGGSFTDPSKWAPAGGPPGPNDTAIFAEPGAPVYTVTVPGNTHAGAMQVIGDNIRLDLLNTDGLTLDSASVSALLIKPNGSTRSRLELLSSSPFGGRLTITAGGIELADFS